MLDIRYHIVSLVAVFLALGLGILIGTIVVQDPDLLEVQDNLIQELSSDLKALDAQNEQSRAKLAQLEQSKRELEAFADSTFPLLVSNRLFGRDVAVIGFRRPGMQEDAERVRDVLAVSGASVKLLYIEQPISEIAARLEKTGFPWSGPPDEGATSVASTARALVDLVISKYDQTVIQALVEAGCLSIDKLGESGGADSVVLMSETADLSSVSLHAVYPLLEAMLGQGIPVIIAAQSRGPETLPIPGAGDIEAVDRLDTIPGKYRLVMALVGEGRKGPSR